MHYILTYLNRKQYFWCRLGEHKSITTHDSFENRSLTDEDEDGTKPLHRADDVPKQQHRPQDGEELPRRRDEGTGERPKIHHSHEDESLGEENPGLSPRSH